MKGYVFLIVLVGLILVNVHATAQEPVEGGFKALVEKRNKKVEEPAPTPAVQAATPTVPEKKPDRKKVAKADERVGPVNSQEESSVRFQIEKTCWHVAFSQVASEALSCVEPVSIKYTKRDCDSRKILEVGETAASVSCDDKSRFNLKFRTSDPEQVVSSQLSVTREQKGRKGVRIRYLSEKAVLEKSSLLKLLPEPTIIEIEAKPSEESPIRYKFSGFAWFEMERSSNFGYDDVGITNFTNGSHQPEQELSTFFSNVNFELAKDNTALVSLLEIGEIYYGDTTSGGNVGARQRVFELRNFYLKHGLYDWLGVSAGVITTSADRRSFIFNDHLSSVQAAYKTDIMEGNVWYGVGAKNRPGSNTNVDEYAGINGSLSLLSGFDHSLYFVTRRQTETFALPVAGVFSDVSFSSRYYWLGGTFVYNKLDPLSIEVTGIANWGKFSAANELDRYLTSYLADIKVSYNFSNLGLVVSAEGLATPGAKDSEVTVGTATRTKVGSRSSFNSPIGTAYLLTIATSDGVDDAPGAGKGGSYVGNLNHAEGLRILILNASQTFSKKLTGFVRYGYLSTQESHSTTNGKELGWELDVGSVYQLSPSTTLQLDYGRLAPGNFYSQRDVASLFAGKVKFVF